MTAPRLSAGGIIAGKYTVRSVLGNGGAVITYHCVSQQGQEVAVKLYDPAVASHATVMKSLEQAYAATNALPQSSTAPIVDAGYDQPTLAPFSVTELLRLPSLASQQRRLQPEEAVALLKGLARSLDLAHVRGVVHGAVKPTNVFLGPACNPVIVTDFAANLPKAAVPTQEGFIGSAPWIAPEQAQSGTVTPAADVFAVGLLLFYSLTGRSYWRSCQGPSFDLNAWQQEVAAARVPASSRAAELGVPLSPTLDIVMWKALSADPNERYKSIGELAGTLEDSLRQQVGAAATMALPMVGDAPSPLPKDMKNPERGGAAAPPNPSLASGATMALPMEALMPPGGGAPGMGPGMGGPGMGPGMGGPGMSGPGMGGPGMGGPGMGGPGMGGPGMGGPGMGGPGMGSPGMGGPGMGGPGMGGPGMGGPGMGAPGGAYAYAQADHGYPPPPNGAAPIMGPGAPPPKSSKVVPIVIGFTAVALVGVVGTLLFLKFRDVSAPPPDGPVAVPSVVTTATAEPTSAATGEPAPTAEPTSSASSSAAAVAKVKVTITCAPACDEVKLDGEILDLTKPLELAPGSYTVEVSKAGFVGQTEKLEVKEGSAPVKKAFTLKAEPTAATTTTATPGPMPTTKPTGGGGGGKPSGGGGDKNCKKVGFITKCK